MINFNKTIAEHIIEQITKNRERYLLFKIYIHNFTSIFIKLKLMKTTVSYLLIIYIKNDAK